MENTINIKCPYCQHIKELPKDCKIEYKCSNCKKDLEYDGTVKEETVAKKSSSSWIFTIIIALVIYFFIRPYIIKEDNPTKKINKPLPVVTTNATNDIQKSSSLNDSEIKNLIMNNAKPYINKIAKSNGGVVQIVKPYICDLDNDGIKDGAVYYNLTPQEGGNMMLFSGLIVYGNNGTALHYIEDYNSAIFDVTKSNGQIIIDKFEYAQNDAECCPSIHNKFLLNIVDSKVELVKINQ